VEGSAYSIFVDTVAVKVELSYLKFRRFIRKIDNDRIFKYHRKEYIPSSKNINDSTHIKQEDKKRNNHFINVSKVFTSKSVAIKDNSKPGFTMCSTFSFACLSGAYSGGFLYIETSRKRIFGNSCLPNLDDYVSFFSKLLENFEVVRADITIDCNLDLSVAAKLVTFPRAQNYLTYHKTNGLYITTQGYTIRLYDKNLEQKIPKVINPEERRISDVCFNWGDKKSYCLLSEKPKPWWRFEFQLRKKKLEKVKPDSWKSYHFPELQSSFKLSYPKSAIAKNKDVTNFILQYVPIQDLEGYLKTPGKKNWKRDYQYYMGKYQEFESNKEIYDFLEFVKSVFSD